MGSAQKEYRDISEAYDLPPFYRPEYLDLCYGPDQWNGITVKTEQGGDLFWPVGRMNKWGFQRILQHYFTPRSGIWMPRDHSVDKNQLIQLIKGLPNYQHFHQSFPTSFEFTLPFEELGFHIEKRITYRLDLSIGKEALWKNMRADYRNNKVGKAEGRFVLIDNVSPDDFYRIHRLTYDRQQIPIYYSREFLSKWHKLMREKGWGKLYGAVDSEGQLCSVAAILYGENTAWLIKAGDDPQRRKEGSGIWLMWQLMAKSTQEGWQNFDFLGSMVPAIARVRKQLGGKPTPYWSISRTRGMIYPSARMVFSLFNRG